VVLDGVRTVKRRLVGESGAQVVVAHDAGAAFESLNHTSEVIGPVALPVYEHNDRSCALVYVVDAMAIDESLFIVEGVDVAAARGEPVEEPPTTRIGRC
jgi:hypothetical protein